jgi:hypothetical protein
MDSLIGEKEPTIARLEAKRVKRRERYSGKVKRSMVGGQDTTPL